MQRLDYHSPGPDDLRLRLRRWENRILAISLVLLLALIILLIGLSVP
ncbi:MAG TPA: hypothetical protein VK797_21600 [Tepidisphaeraceae bacterium]|nr:hypothetical protein [Tepidisphaeraceae bacterium]